ncbi:MAG TPA: ribosomal protein S18-alanine N-acetyltransferase [Terriglobia bacterium]|nr:ribosomal protein S18-alanine N-acetyltransferase [Terriglobia bacterium]
MKIRPIASCDLPDVLRIQQESALNSGWHEDDYRRLIEAPGGLILVAYEDSPGPIAGFVAANLILGHAELLSMAVAPEMRRRGIGKNLLLEACRYMRDTGALSISLEVRASNLSAIGLYHSVGFAACRTRKDYYSNPLEDACAMALSLTGAAPVENEYKPG